MKADGTLDRLGEARLEEVGACEYERKGPVNVNGKGRGGMNSW